MSPEHLVAKIELFAGLTEAECAEVVAETRWTRYRDRSQIVGEGDLTTDVFFVAEGSIQAKSFAHSGKEVTYTEVHAGGLFGEFSAIDGAARSATIITCGPSTIGRMNGAQFRASMLAHPQLHLRVTELLVRKVRDLSRRVFEFSTLNVCARVHAELLRLLPPEAASPDGDGAARNNTPATAVIEPAPTHQDLASRISTHREAVTRELNYLAKTGVIALSRRRIDILDLPRLLAMSEAETGD